VQLTRAHPAATATAAVQISALTMEGNAWRLICESCHAAHHRRNHVQLTRTHPAATAATVQGDLL
jgi:hypothetical protein